MTKLKLSFIDEDKPVKLTVELSAALHRDLIAYAAMMAAVSGQAPPDPTKLISAMLSRFIATDRGFAKLRRGDAASNQA